MQRTHILETKDLIGKEVTLFGWVNVRRDHGKIIFIDLRDRSGVVQMVFVPNPSKVRPPGDSRSDLDLYETASKLRSEWVIRVKGKVKERPEKMVNPEIETGKIEIEPLELEVLNESLTPPFPLDTSGDDIDEEIRLKYRYLDLRRPRLQKNIKLRSEFVDKVRQFLFKKGFTEIETPILSAPTPEGSRDFIVPSRLNPGKFFALPQSPQQYKQLLMVAGFEKYFQIARCFRDEDLRADRGFEHTQIDIEVSFVDQEEFMALDEEMITAVVESMGYKIKQKPFPVFTHKEATDKFGADKFDLRTEEDKKNGILAYAWVKDFPFFEKVEEKVPALRSSDRVSPEALAVAQGAKKWTFTHNPFSHAKSEHLAWLLKGEHIDKILTTQYDLVCNGLEVGGGSIRAHRPEMLKAVFEVMGYKEKEIEEQFGHMLEAFKYGAPPHGGIAHGIERNLMVFAKEDYLRETQAFPQTSSGRTAVMTAPSELSKKQLKELHLKIER
ncbi:MAG: amino acid--tRNA ligase-related protein [Candidatus Taylorbacteria bacterium]|nr:amino acid--tRNA ligase-related protein [Candidatus Taylorbacteria bacterium]